MNPRQWFRFENTDGGTVADIHILDLIGSWDDDWIARNWGYDMGVTARAFVEQLAQLPESTKSIRVHINSPGGDVFAAMNIANALRDQQTSKGRAVETIIDGLAASAASIVAMAGSTIRMADNALLMIHNPWTVALGEAKDMRKTAETLDTIRNTIIAAYRWHSELDVDAIAALMDAETWMDADQALEQGFATEKVAGLRAAAALDGRALATLKVPAQYQDRVSSWLKPAPPPPPAPPAAASAETVIAACVKAGLDLSFAQALIADKTTDAGLEARITTEVTRKAESATRAAEITALCTMAKAPTLAEGYIRGGMAVADIRAHLTTIAALRDGSLVIDNTLPVDQGGRTKATLNPSDIYAARNRKA